MSIKVKPLEWTEQAKDTFGASSIIGNISVFKANLPNFPETWHVWNDTNDYFMESASTKEEAQEKAFKYVEHVIRGACYD